MKRSITNRFPMYGGNHNGMGRITIISGLVICAFSGLIAYRRFQKVEEKRKKLEKYQDVDPNTIVPLGKDIVKVDHLKLQKAVIEGPEQLIMEEMGLKPFSSPEEYVYQTTKGIDPRDKGIFMSYVRHEFEKLGKTR
jgi:hypothetical protein